MHTTNPSALSERAKRASRRVAILIAATSPAAANPRPLPFTYTTETLAPGAIELEQIGDLTPLRALSPMTAGPVWYLGTQFQTELEIGLAERLELGLYFTYAPQFDADRLASTAPMIDGNGFKQRLRYTLAPPGEWPVDVGVYGEIAENEREVELEGKILLAHRFGALQVAANLWAEYEIELGKGHDVVLDPTAGATYQIAPSVHLGVDSWMRAEYPSSAPANRPYGLGPIVYAGPALLIDFGKLWWSTGAYGRVTDFDHAMQPGEPYGRVWFRTMIGYAL
jgi:hypothetical protein